MDTLLTLHEEKMENSLRNNEKLIEDLVKLSVNENNKIKWQKKEKKNNKINSENKVKNKDTKKERKKLLNKKQRKISNNDNSNKIINDKNAIDNNRLHKNIICNVCEMNPIKGDR